ncbi:endolytic transglycosylase MltG [Streptomyces sp. NPDC050560]|uniref:endolytic transglycosylase MltG n=1 Tax=Streptomyces sp. NPDC050560 TaxID=3365630 RepID=UPI00379C8E48
MDTKNPRQSKVRLTRRGRIVIIAASAVAAAGALAAVVPLLIPDGQDQRPRALTIPEGWRARQVYDAVDKALDAPPGTTRQSLPHAGLRLPQAARGNPEGYLFPATYPVREDATPRTLLAAMVDHGTKKFGGNTVTAGAESNAMNVYQAVTVASLVQAEAATPGDMAKVARVIYNRLDRGMPLQLDATLNYALNRTTVHTSKKDIALDNPYNTYNRMGLPPTPIGNPGDQALRAALDPAPGDWLYFVTVKPGDTRFASTYAEQMKNVDAFNKHHSGSASAH